MRPVRRQRFVLENRTTRYGIVTERTNREAGRRTGSVGRRRIPVTLVTAGRFKRIICAVMLMAGTTIFPLDMGSDAARHCGQLTVTLLTVTGNVADDLTGPNLGDAFTTAMVGGRIFEVKSVDRIVGVRCNNVAQYEIVGVTTVEGMPAVTFKTTDWLRRVAMRLVGVASLT